MENNNKFYYALLIFILLYSLFIFIRPYEDDESAYILTGISIVKGELHPFKSFHSPLSTMMGSPLVPILYGIAYIIGGILLTRVVSLFSVMVSIYLVHKIIKNQEPKHMYLLLIGLSSSTILIASTSYLDSIALLFLVLSIYFINDNKYLLAGIFSGLAAISKFILLLPIFVIIIYMGVFRKRWNYLHGSLIIIIPFLFFYREIVPVLIDFIYDEKIRAISYSGVGIPSYKFYKYYPVMLTSALFFFVKRKIKKHIVILAAILSIIFYHVISLDFISWGRHLPYIEFLSTILIGLNIKKIRVNKILVFFIIVYFYLSLSSAFADIYNYPSYRNIKSHLFQVDGKVLAVNPYSYALTMQIPLKSIGKNITSYHYFEYGNTSISSLEGYQKAIEDEFFDYAIVSSYSPPEYYRYQQIENHVRKYYCPLVKNNKNNGLDIYKKC